jgi:DNA-binding transcriptional regulator YiaG
VGVLLAGIGTTATLPSPRETLSAAAYVLEHSTTAGTTVSTHSNAGAQIGELRRLTGFTWDQLANLFGLSRRSLHFWASGKPMASSNEEHLHRLLAAVRKVDQGSAAKNRTLLLSPSRSGEVPTDLLAAQKYDHALQVLGELSSPPRTTPVPLSKARREERRPRPVAELVGALQDSVHKDLGKTRVARSVRTRGAG